MSKAKKNIVKPNPLQFKITFWLKYHTNYGEQIFLTSQHSFFKNKPIALQYYNQDFWKVTLTFNTNEIIDENIFYHYYVTKNENIIAVDDEFDKTFNPSKQKDFLQIIDAWKNTSHYENIFYTKPFTDVLLKKTNLPKINQPKNFTHIFKVKAPLLQKSQTLCLLGNSNDLKNWDTENPILLFLDDDKIHYTTFIKLNTTINKVEYKYGVYDTEKKSFIHYEEGSNRVLYDETISSKKVIVNDGYAVLPLNIWKGAGIAIPVFSIRTENGFGVGEFSDIKLLVDWSVETGIKLIQLLPINDTTATNSWKDSYPYAAISAFALHPIYLNIDELVDVENKDLLQKLNVEKKKFNKSSTLQYEAVLKTKWNYIKKIFSTQKEKTFSSSEYKNFFNKNKFWLIPYAAFCYLKDEYATANFNEWILYKHYKQEDIIALTEEKSSVYYDIAIHYFVQFYLHQQLKQAVYYAHNNGVVIKGDLPIGVNKHSVDVWQKPKLFNEQLQAGAPPDVFTNKGQNWGFPTYQWENMKAENYDWWKNRLLQMNEYFDAYRIDHILGFFRIWSIPSNCTEGIMGHFVPAISIKKNELIERGIKNNLQRFTKPFITNEYLQELFEDDKAFVIKKFLIKNKAGIFSLQECYSSQIQVEQAFATLPSNEKNKKIKLGLLEIISNVILFEVENSKGEEFHFRFDMDKTFSFKQLDESTQQQLKALYIDYFFYRQNELWKNEALQKLPTLKRFTNMLVCGEDLGLVPSSIPEVMNDLGILSLEVQRMSKDSNKTFSHPNDAPYLSVVTPSTHDMSTIRGWWKEDKNTSQKFYNTVLHQKGKAPVDCEVWISKAIIVQHLFSSAIWSIFQIQDLMGMDEKIRRESVDEERINIPANEHHNWCYRMHITVENLLQQKIFNAELKKIIQLSGR